MKEFRTSIRVPLTISTPTLPTGNAVTSFNNILGDVVDESSTLPSARKPAAPGADTG